MSMICAALETDSSVLRLIGIPNHDRQRHFGVCSKSIIDTNYDGENASPVLKSSEMRNIMKKVSFQPLYCGGERCTLKLCRELKRAPVGVVWELGEGLPAQVSSSSLDHGSKLRDPSPKALV
ncbi:hypothetical protein TNCV_3030111 [Trichonephila clavipes]|nr:hypothetical protein TNCV_3030111 [Trichonephila clavipes]